MQCDLICETSGKQFITKTNLCKTLTGSVLGVFPWGRGVLQHPPIGVFSDVLGL